MTVVSKCFFAYALLVLAAFFASKPPALAEEPCLALYNALNALSTSLNTYENARDGGDTTTAKSVWQFVERDYSHYTDVYAGLPGDFNLWQTCDTDTQNLLADLQARYDIDGLRNGTSPLNKSNLDDADLDLSMLSIEISNGFDEPRMNDLKEHLRQMYAALHLQIPDDLNQ